MELWIRSQDRTELVQVKNINIEDFDDIGKSFNIYGKGHFLGTYKTGKRALEVLDEIQKYLTPTIQMLDVTLKDKQVVQVNSISTFVYEMPKE